MPPQRGAVHQRVWLGRLSVAFGLIGLLGLFGTVWLALLGPIAIVLGAVDMSQAPAGQKSKTLGALGPLLGVIHIVMIVGLVAAAS